MNKPLAFLLRLMGFNRHAPKTPFGRNLRRAERLMGSLAVLYIALHIFPQVIFAHSVTAEGITIYSLTSSPPEASACASLAAALLRQSELAVPGCRLFASGDEHPSPSYRDFKFREMVRSLSKKQHMSFTQIVARARESASVEEEVRQTLPVPLP